jgi:hypothetical protein
MRPPIEAASFIREAGFRYFYVPPRRAVIRWFHSVASRNARWRGQADTHSFDPPDPIDRPLCTYCDWIMWIARIEAHEPGYDRYTLKCHRCDTEETKIVKL